MPASATAPCRPYVANLGRDRATIARRRATHQGVNGSEHASTLAVRQPPRVGGVLGHGLAHDEALRLAQTRRGCPKRARCCLIEHKGEFSHTYTILPYTFGRFGLPNADCWIADCRLPFADWVRVGLRH